MTATGHTPAATPYRKIALADQHHLTASEYAHAQHIAAVMGSLHRADVERGAQASHGWRDPLGRAKYGDLIDVERVLNPSFEFVNELRLNGTFTGYRLRNLVDGGSSASWSDEMAATEPPDDAPDWSVTAYRRIVHDLPRDLVVTPPPRMGEVGWLVDGAVVNRDVLAYQERLALLHHSGVLDRLRSKPRVNILEIGGGYGGFAYFLRQALPQARYVICDLPLSLFFSASYLALAGGRGATGVTFVPSFRFEQALAIEFDLAVNTLSFSEMPSAVVDGYAAGIARSLSPDGLLFEQNFDCSHYGQPSFCDPEPILGRHFAHRQVIAPFNRWGKATIWAPRPSPAWTTVETSRYAVAPALVEANHHGFNIVFWREKVYAFALTLGALNIRDLDATAIARLEHEGTCVSGRTLEAVKNAIALLARG